MGGTFFFSLKGCAVRVMVAAVTTPRQTQGGSMSAMMGRIYCWCGGAGIRLVFTKGLELATMIIGKERRRKGS
jgi:hypothetical protein